MGSLARGPPIEGLGSAGLVQLGVDGAGRLRGYAGHAFQLLLRGGEKALRRSEVLQERAPACRPDALELVEDRRERARVAPLAVEADREPVRLVPDALQQLQSR